MLTSQYLIIGNGRVAKHFQHYFTLLGLTVSHWNRSQPVQQLQNELLQATHVLVLISDKAIAEFIQQHLTHYQGYIIHCSGSLVLANAVGAHPLLGFTPNLYSLEKYTSIPFILDHDAPDFTGLLPGLPNPHARLDKILKPKYHALCVLAGNFSCMLWQKLMTDFKQELNFPFNIAFPYLMQQTENLMHDPAKALTGPLVRNDVITIEKNLAALKDDPFAKIYQSFVNCYQQLLNNEECT